jgi:hypothetical protein
MSSTADTRYWVLLETPRGLIVYATQDHLPESDIAYLRQTPKYDVVDRVADPLPPYRPEIVA